MPDSFREFQRTFEIFANQQAAEIEAVRAVLQGLVVRSLSGNPQKAALFSQLRDDVLGRLETAAKQNALDQAKKRKAEFVLQNATLILDEMAPAFGLKPSGSSDPAN